MIVFVVLVVDEVADWVDSVHWTEEAAKARRRELEAAGAFARVVRSEVRR